MLRTAEPSESRADRRVPIAECPSAEYRSPIARVPDCPIADRRSPIAEYRSPSRLSPIHEPAPNRNRALDIHPIDMLRSRLLRGTLALEASLICGGYYVFHRMNTSHEFRYRMGKEYPTVLRGFSVITGWNRADDVPLLKRDLRKHIANVLKTVDTKKESETILNRLKCAKGIRQSTTAIGEGGQRLLLSDKNAVSVYLNMPKGEVETWPNTLIWLFDEEANDEDEDKKKYSSATSSHPRPLVYVPKVVGSKSQDMLMLRVDSTEQIRSFRGTNRWKIMEPSEEEAMEMIDAFDDALSSSELIDLILVPGVAFDRQCRRLGHGKGYYDAFLDRLNRLREKRGLHPAVTIGIAFDEQIVDEVPVNENDRTLDFVVTPSRTFARLPKGV